MKHRRWMTMLFALILVAAVFLLPGSVTQAEAAGPLRVEWYDGDGWYTHVACGSTGEMANYKYECHYTIYSAGYIRIYSIYVELPEGFYYTDGTTAKSARVVPKDVNEGRPMDFIMADIMTPYLPNAQPGDIYYADVTIQGSVYIKDDVYSPFTQQLKVPILRITDVWNEVTVNDSELGTCTITWNESMLTNEYNQQAAELSAVLSRLAYDEEAIKDALKQLGCYKVDTYHWDAGLDINSMGVHVGVKKIIENGKPKNIIFAVARGTTMHNQLDYREWAGNLNAGSEVIHRGFEEAGDSLYWLSVNDHYSETENNAESFIFYTGHSKGAAAANFAAHRANLMGYDCVAYTFATPNVAKGIGTSASGEKGIYNWVYYQDMIRNAPSMAQYGRYGSTTIFGFETPPEHYWGILEDDFWLDSCGVTHTVRNGFTMQEYLNAVFHMTDTGDIPGSLYSVISILLEEGYQFDQVGECHEMGVYYKAVKKNLPGAYIPDVQIRTDEAVDAVISAWADMHITRVVQHVYYCPVDVYVYDLNGNLAGSIVGDQVTINDENLILYTLLDSKAVMYMEELEGEYDIQVVGYADGTVTHSTTYFTADGASEMLVSQTIPVSNGQSISFATDPHGDSSYTTYTDEAQIKEVVYDLLGMEPEEESLPFTDVPEGKWYYNAVDYVYNRGLMNGTSDTKFEPTGTMTRAMLATVIYRAAGAHALPNEMPFTDIPEGKWYTDAVNWAYINKIVNGTSDTLFSPNSQITREQIVTMFYRYAQNWRCDTSIQADLSGYTDAGKIGNYAKEPFRWAVAAGIINGTTDTTLEPKAFATRAQCAAIMQRFNEYIGQ